MLTALLTAAAAYGALVLFLYFGQTGLVYLPDLPSRTISATPGDVGLAYETVHLHTEDGIRLHAWHVPAPSPRGTLLFFHGNAGNISHRLDSLLIFHRLGLDVLIFDYRGYGQSEGTPSEAGTRLDSRAAWRHLTETRGVKPGRIILFGRSLGAALAAWLASEVRPAGLILESAFTSVPDLAADLYWWLPARHMSKLQYAARDHLAKVACPVLVAHSPDDEIIPFRHGLELFAAAREPKRFLELKGDHNRGFLLSGEAYVAGLDAFLQSHLGAGQAGGRNASGD